MTLNDWWLMSPPKSHWRWRARQAMRTALLTYAKGRPPTMPFIDTAATLEPWARAELTGIVDAAYPFGARENHPYKAWLAERSLLKLHMADSREPTWDEAAAVVVARDLVQLGRLDEARTLLKEQAPHRLSLPCRACGAKRGRDCKDEDGVKMVAPHDTRMVPKHRAPNPNQTGLQL